MGAGFQRVDVSREAVPLRTVTIYTRAMCGYCERAKRLLRENGVPFEEKDATFDPGLRHEMVERAGGRRTFPQVFVGDTHVGGSDDLAALHARGGFLPLVEMAE